jgi:hypothetical protein
LRRHDAPGPGAEICDHFLLLASRELPDGLLTAPRPDERERDADLADVLHDAREFLGYLVTIATGRPVP